MACQQQTQQLGFMSVSLASQRLQSSLSTPVRQISRSVANSAQRMLQISGQYAQHRLADVSRKIAGPVAFKLHHDFLMTRGGNNVGLIVGGSSQGYPRAAHTPKIQPVLGGSRLRTASQAPVKASRVQGGVSNKPTQVRTPRTSSLPGGRGLGQRPKTSAVIQEAPIPSSVRFVPVPSSYTISAPQGGKIQSAIRTTIKGRKNLPGGANLGNKITFSPASPQKAQAGAGLLNKSLRKEGIKAVQSTQGGASHAAKAFKGIERSGMMGGMGLGKKRDGAAKIVAAPRQGGAQLGHKGGVHEILASPTQGGPSQAAKQF